MSNRMNNPIAMLKLAGVASLVLFVGAATIQPVYKPAARASVIAPTRTAAVAIPAPRTAPAADLMHDATPAAATLPPSSSITKRLHTIRMEVTAYCPCTKCCGENAQGITASGHDVSYNNSRFVAADNGLPFGTKLVIPGYAGGAVEVIDRGGAIKGHKLDVFFPTHEEALQWGRQFVEVTVLE